VERAESNELPLAIALFGIGVISSTAFPALAQLFSRVGGPSGSSCGGGGDCGGGGGCGDGCGGGCGGCGGCSGH
jgi:hypothetical protein